MFLASIYMITIKTKLLQLQQNEANNLQRGNSNESGAGSRLVVMGPVSILPMDCSLPVKSLVIFPAVLLPQTRERKVQEQSRSAHAQPQVAGAVWFPPVWGPKSVPGDHRVGQGRQEQRWLHGQVSAAQLCVSSLPVSQEVLVKLPSYHSYVDRC